MQAAVDARTDYQQPACGTDKTGLFARAAAKPDVYAAPGHIRGNGNPVRPSGVRNNPGLFRIVSGIENAMPYAAPCQQAGKMLGFLHALRTDEHRLSLSVRGLDTSQNCGLVFLLPRKN